MVKPTTLLFSICLLVAADLSGPTPAGAQATGESGSSGSGGPAVAVADSDEARRQIVRDVLGRPQVQDAARVAGIDLQDVAADIERLDGEPLARAARQAEELDRRLAIDGVISSTTLILLLIITILLIVILQD